MKQWNIEIMKWKKEIMAGIGWKWLEIAGHSLKWLEQAMVEPSWPVLAVKEFGTDCFALFLSISLKIFWQCSYNIWCANRSKHQSLHDSLYFLVIPWSPWRWEVDGKSSPVHCSSGLQRIVMWSVDSLALFGSDKCCLVVLSMFSAGQVVFIW